MWVIDGTEYQIEHVDTGHLFYDTASLLRSVFVEGQRIFSIDGQLFSEDGRKVCRTYPGYCFDTDPSFILTEVDADKHRRYKTLDTLKSIRAEAAACVASDEVDGRYVDLFTQGLVSDALIKQAERTLKALQKLNNLIKEERTGHARRK